MSRGEDGVYRFSNSELKTYLRCPRKWWFAHFRQLAPKAPKVTGPLNIGIRVHEALATYYAGEWNQAAALKVYREAAQADVDALMSVDPFADTTKLISEIELGQIMLEGYFDWVEETGADEMLEIIAPETTIEAPLQVPGDQVHLRGKLDVRVKRKFDGAQLFMDHKTVASLDQFNQSAQMEQQFLTYQLLMKLEEAHGRQLRDHLQGDLPSAQRAGSVVVPLLSSTGTQASGAPQGPQPSEQSPEQSSGGAQGMSQHTPPQGKEAASQRGAQKEIERGREAPRPSDTEVDGGTTRAPAENDDGKDTQSGDSRQDPTLGANQGSEDSQVDRGVQSSANVEARRSVSRQDERGGEDAKENDPWRLYSGRGVDGGIYNLLRKVKRTAQARPPFYDRIEVRHNDTELRNFYARVHGIVRQVLDAERRLNAGEDHHYVVPPNPTRDCQWDCAYRLVCPLFDDGSRAEQFVEDYYRVEDADARYEDAKGSPEAL